MIIIAHRGNKTGPSSQENKPNYLLSALEKGLNVEVDVWVHNGKWFLGHDAPLYEVSYNFISMENMWIHCKNYDALNRLSETNLNYFWHQEDAYTLTSHNFIWAYPGRYGTSNTIAVLPEYTTLSNNELNNFCGICTDYTERYINDKNNYF